MLGVGGYAPSVASMKSDSPAASLGIYTAKENNAVPYQLGYSNAQEILDAAQSGKIDPYTAQYLLAQGSSTSLEYKLSPEQEKYLNNLLSKYQSQNALIWQAEQLQALGLGNSGVLQTGAARTAMDSSNIANNRANRTASIANSMISMAGRMGAAGIHGAALASVKGAASQAASTLAHSASSAMYSSMTKEEEDDLMAFFDGR